MVISLLSILFFLDSSYACSNAAQCIYEWNFNNWKGSYTFQVLMFIGAIVLLGITLKDELGDRTNLSPKTILGLYFVFIFAFLLTITQSYGGTGFFTIIYLVILVGLAGISYLLFIIFKGKENDIFSPWGYAGIAVSIFVFIRLVQIMFGNNPYVQNIPIFEALVNFSLGWNILDILLVGILLMAYFKHKQNQEHGEFSGSRRSSNQSSSGGGFFSRSSNSNVGHPHPHHDVISDNLNLHQNQQPVRLQKTQVVEILGLIQSLELYLKQLEKVELKKEHTNSVLHLLVDLQNHISNESDLTLTGNFKGSNMSFTEVFQLLQQKLALLAQSSDESTDFTEIKTDLIDLNQFIVNSELNYHVNDFQLLKRLITDLGTYLMNHGKNPQEDKIYSDFLIVYLEELYQFQIVNGDQDLLRAIQQLVHSDPISKRQANHLRFVLDKISTIS